MSYSESKLKKASLEQAVSLAESALRSFTANEKGCMGLTPDHIKALPEYQAAKANFNHAFKQLQTFNSQFIKTYKTEITQERKAARMN